MTITTLEERFFKKVNKTESCWIWIAGKGTQGYGRFRMNGTTHNAHRISYLIKNKNIPEGLDVDHLCRNRLCVNPNHLEAVTRKENVLRGNSPCAKNKIKTICKRGHDLSIENTYITSKGYRRCRACDLLRWHGVI